MPNDVARWKTMLHDIATKVGPQHGARRRSRRFTMRDDSPMVFDGDPMDDDDAATMIGR